tara:strand:+ start:2528 stop:3445 length:918 start_codon:yes stop_codon:yes gene_type:complete
MRTLILALLLTVSAFAFADNEIYIEQVGEGVEIIIEQTGNGNLIGQNTNTGANATDMKLQIGNSNAYWLFNGSNNLLFGDINSDGSNIDYNLVGSNNRINQLIGTVDGNTSSNYSADAIDMNVDVQGSYNQTAFRLGNKSETYNTPYNLGDGAFFNNSAGFRTYSAHTFTGSNITGYGTYGGNATSNYGSNAAYWDAWNITEGSADGANIDLLVDGSGASNTIGAFINSSNAIWDWDITGSNNWILTTQEDGSDNKISVDLTGDKNYVFVGQRTGTGLNSTEAILDASFVTDGSEITIIQQDTGE